MTGCRLWSCLGLALLAVVLGGDALQDSDSGLLPSSDGSEPNRSSSGSNSSSKNNSRHILYKCFFNECPVSHVPREIPALRSCLTTAFLKDTERKAVLPGSPAFAHASRMVSMQHAHIPAAVVYAHRTADVQAAVRCAASNKLQVTVAGGRHSFEGWSVVPGFVVVDTSNMTEVNVVGQQGSTLTVQVGPGNTNGLLISQLHNQGYKTAAAVIGQCPSVGLSGYTLGGGLSDMSRMLGLACDQVVSLEMVTHTGDVVIANATHHSDLLWASCGGGGGLGVVTQWTFRAIDLGDQAFSRIEVKYNEESALLAMLKVQDFIMSNQTDLRFTGGLADLGNFVIYFAGSLSTAMPLLKQEGLLNQAWLDRSIPSSAKQSRAHLNLKDVTLLRSTITGMPAFGVAAFTFATFYEAMQKEECRTVAGWYYVLSVMQAEAFGFGRSKSCDDVATLNQFKALAAQPGSVINTGISDIWRQYSLNHGCRMLPPLNQTAWEALVAVIEDPKCTSKGSGSVEQMAQQLEEDPDGTYYCIALKHLVGKPRWNHLLGGAVAQVPQSATAFPWRKAFSPMCFWSSLPGSLFEADGVTLKTTFKLDYPWIHTPLMSTAATVRAIEAVQATYIRALNQALGEDTTRRAYLNYQTEQVRDYEAAYWGPNYAKLQKIKAKWDPEGMFSKPFTVQPATT